MMSLCHRGSFFCNFLSFALSSKMQSKICYGEEFNRCKIHGMVEICLEFGTFEEFATAFMPRDVRHHMITFLESHEWNQQYNVKWPKKEPFQ